MYYIVIKRDGHLRNVESTRLRHLRRVLKYLRSDNIILWNLAYD